MGEELLPEINCNTGNREQSNNCEFGNGSVGNSPGLESSREMKLPILQNDLLDTARPLEQETERETGNVSSESEETEELNSDRVRRHRRSSIVSYKEPNMRSKLRAGDQFTFSSGYEPGIKILSMAEKDRERRKKARQSLS